MNRFSVSLCVFFTGLGGLLSSPLAHAQNPPATTGTGTCEGMVDGKAISGKTYLALNETLIAEQLAGRAFGRAECTCRTRDIKMRVNMDPSGLVAQTTSAAATTMWVGSDFCSVQTMRTQNALCDQMSASNPAGNDQFKLDVSSFKSIGNIDTILPAEALSNPRPIGTTAANWHYNCDPDDMVLDQTERLNISGQQNRSAIITIGPDSMPATCKLPLTINLSPPKAITPTINSIDSGDGALSVNWSVPDMTAGIEFYQLACRKKSAPNTPVMSPDFLAGTQFWYSACLYGNMMYRRPIGAVAQNTGNGTDPEAKIDQTKYPDFEFPLDPRFRCSDKVTANSFSLNTRISGLENLQDYEVAVIAIDPYGNPVPSETKEGTPRPTVNPLEGFCEGAQCPNGFGCQAAGALPAGAGAPLAVSGLGLGLLLGARRRRRS